MYIKECCPADGCNIIVVFDALTMRQSSMTTSLSIDSGNSKEGREDKNHDVLGPNSKIDFVI